MSSLAERLYEENIRPLPALFRCGRGFVAALAAGKPYGNAAQLLPLADPFVRAILRAAGTDETFVAGAGSDLEKFRAFCAAAEDMRGSALPRECEMLFWRALDCDLPLDAVHADEIWEKAARRLAAEDLTPAALLRKCGVTAAIAPADPADDLADFAASAEITARPVFCPDALLSLDQKALAALGEREEIVISDLDGLSAALDRALDRFAARGCRAAAHTVFPVAFSRPDAYHADLILKKILTGAEISNGERALFAAQLWRVLGAGYARRGMVLELPVRTAASLAALSPLWRYLTESGCALRAALYLSEPEAIAAAVAIGGEYPVPAGGEPPFAYGLVAGSPTQTRALLAAFANAAPLARFAGVFPDLSLPALPTAPELFCRTLCDLFAEWTEHGEMKSEDAAPLAERVAYRNAADLFGI